MWNPKMAAGLLYLGTLAAGQGIGTSVPEVHPKLTTQVCTTAGGCVTRQSSLVTDSLSRPLHLVGNPAVPCSITNKTLCPDAITCAKNCELEGVEYGSMGVLASGSALTLRAYLFNGDTFKLVSPRMYLLAEDEENYEVLKLVNQELSYEVDVSKLGCGMNGALYLTEMDPSGSRSDANPAGATYGTGYCDAQCFNTTWINGLPNLNNSGACCNEMDIWEANSVANAMTPHPCSSSGPFLCAGTECNGTTASVCDKNGCGLNPFNTGAKDFYGPNMTVDTTRPFTVVTQFVGTASNSSSNTTGGGTLTQIRRLYVQDGMAIQNAPLMDMSGSSETASTPAGAISQDFCTAVNSSSFLRLGGVQAMGQSLDRGMVLIFSLWNSQGDFMNWLDSGNAGPCNSTAGNPALIVANDPEVSVTFSNIRWGDIGSTFNATSGSTAATALAGVQQQQEAAATKISGALSIHTSDPAGVSMIMAAMMGFFLL